MENRDTRIENLKALVAEFRSIVTVAKACGTAEAYLSQLLNHAPLPSGAARSIGHKLARKLEAVCLKPVGWLDQPHGDKESDPLTPYSGLSGESLLAARSLDALPDSVRHQIRIMISTIVAALHTDVPETGVRKSKRIDLHKDVGPQKSTATDRNRHKRA